MAGNRGATTLKCKRRSQNPMRDFDRLPAELRAWVSSAILPWRAKSVERAFQRALKRTGDIQLALRELDKLQDSLVAKDAQRVWGVCHPHSKHV